MAAGGQLNQCSIRVYWLHTVTIGGKTGQVCELDHNLIRVWKALSSGGQGLANQRLLVLRKLPDQGLGLVGIPCQDRLG
jgi:hypothetical protein